MTNFKVKIIVMEEFTTNLTLRQIEEIAAAQALNKKIKLDGKTYLVDNLTKVDLKGQAQRFRAVLQRVKN